MCVISHIMTHSWQVMCRNDLHTRTARYGFLNLSYLAECVSACTLPTWNTTWRSVNNSRWTKNITVSLWYIFVFYMFIIVSFQSPLLHVNYKLFSTRTSSGTWNTLSIGINTLIWLTDMKWLAKTEFVHKDLQKSFYLGTNYYKQLNGDI